MFLNTSSLQARRDRSHGRQAIVSAWHGDIPYCDDRRTSVDEAVAAYVTAYPAAITRVEVDAAPAASFFLKSDRC